MKTNRGNKFGGKKESNKFSGKKAGKKFGGRNSIAGKKFVTRDSAKRSFERRDPERGTLHKAVCSDCRQTCEVPFKPNGEKPVFCFDCFRKNDNGDSRGPMHRATCSDCGNQCELSFKPAGKKPIYCTQCFSKNLAGGPKEPRKNEPSNTQLELINAKLDQILELLNKPKVKKVKSA